MSWRDRLRPATFRGVPFFVLSDEAEFGRRQVTHTAALVDVPTLEDLGRAADVFQIEGYLVGEDYDLAMLELVKAIRDTPGEGVLVHPRYGERSVGASGFRIKHDSKEGRMCRFVVTFGEAGELSQPTESVDGISVLSSRAGMILDESQGDFASRFSVDGLAQFVRDAAASPLNSIADYLTNPSMFAGDVFTDDLGVFGSVANLIDVTGDALAGYQRLVSIYRDGIPGLMGSPSGLAGSIVGLVQGIRGAFGSSAGGVLAGLYRRLPDEPQGAPVGLTPSRTQIILNRQAIAQLVKQNAVAQLAIVSASTEYETIDDAIQTRDALADLLDQQAETTPSDTMYSQLTQARAEVIAAIPAAEQSAARIVPYTPAATLPALVIAQTLYDDGTRDGQIVARNSVRHPGFVPGGQALQVLSDG
jgi:prophage DNA circulation protein